jgi:anaerobic ribonucleoside-triphosphate reductase activating protein
MAFFKIGNLFYPSYNAANTRALEIYLSGCNRTPKCKGCHNPELWDFSKGINMSINGILAFIKKLPPSIRSIAVMGGEPLHQPKLKELLEALRTTNKTIWLYTSYELHEIPKEIRLLCDFIKTGKYEETLQIKGERVATSNQKIFKRKGEDFDVYYAYK